MGSRVVLVVLAAMVAVFAVSCGTCRWRSSQPDVVNVRWPATSPVTQVQELPRDVPDAPLPETEVAPGVRVREGTAHDLSYIEIVFGEADFDDALPLVVLLHGRGDRPRIPGGPFGGVPTPMRLVMPRGPLRLGAGFAWVLPSVTQGTPDLLANSLRTRTHHLAALIDTLSRTLPTLGRPIVTGFSQGALLTFSLALHRPDVVGHAFPIAGWVPPGLMPVHPVAPERRVPIRSAHGTEDTVIPIAPTREVVAALRALEWDVDLLEFEGVGHLASSEMNATFEAWLEQVLREEAPELTGGGLGLVGPEEGMYEPWESLEPETIEAIEQLEARPDEPSEPEDDEVAQASIARLAPDVFPDLPADVRLHLERLNCTIPQSWFDEQPHNVVRGRFTDAATTDIAILCSDGQASKILVFRAGQTVQVDELASYADDTYVQRVDEQTSAFSRALGVATPADIQEHHDAYGGPTPPPLDHDGINDMFVEKASVVWYWHDGQWLRLQGAD